MWRKSPVLTIENHAPKISSKTVEGFLSWCLDWLDSTDRIVALLGNRDLPSLRLWEEP